MKIMSKMIRLISINHKITKVRQLVNLYLRFKQFNNKINQTLINKYKTNNNYSKINSNRTLDLKIIKI